MMGEAEISYKKENRMNADEYIFIIELLPLDFHVAEYEGCVLLLAIL